MPVKQLLKNIERLKQNGDLAAVIVHLNDTYLLEESRPTIPGMARIATLIRKIRNSAGVDDRGRDRTLVLHSGDFLSPSRLSFATQGKSMVEALVACGVSAITLGNHEIDHGDHELRIRMSELAKAGVRIICSNLTLVPPLQDAKPYWCWPDEIMPLLAVVGLLSKRVASCFKGDWKSMHVALCAMLNNPSVKKANRLVVLSHADHAEDVTLMRSLNKKLTGAPSFAYLLGGHDHDVNWSQVPSPTRMVFSKNLSNARAVRVFAVSFKGLIVDQLRRLKDATAPYDQLATEIHDILDPEKGFGAAADLQALLKEFSALSKGKEVPPLKHTLRNLLAPIDWRGDLGARLSERDLFTLKPDPKSNRSIKLSQKKLEPIKKTFSYKLQKLSKIDCSDASTRSRPTPFGAFIADCVEKNLGVDAVLLHSGLFRADSTFTSTRVTNRLLADVFLYPEDELLIAKMTAGELRSLIQHGRSKPNTGAYPQLSGGAEDILNISNGSTGCIHVAVPSYLFLSTADLDGYQKALLDHSKEKTKQTPQERAKAWKKSPLGLRQAVAKAKHELADVRILDPHEKPLPPPSKRLSRLCRQLLDFHQEENHKQRLYLFTMACLGFDRMAWFEVFDIQPWPGTGPSDKAIECSKQIVEEVAKYCANPKFEITKLLELQAAVKTFVPISDKHRKAGLKPDEIIEAIRFHGIPLIRSP